MRNIKKSQLLLILAGVFVIIGLYFAPRSNSSEKPVEMEELIGEEASNDHDHVENAPDLSISEDQQEYIARLEEKAVKIEDVEVKLSLYDSIIEYSKNNRWPPLVAKYTEEKSKLISTASNWILTGDAYFKAFRLSKNQSESMISKTIYSYNKAIELDSGNLNAQAALGVAYVEGAALLGEMPMKGIGILKEVLNKDPKNINALINLGYFAIQSGQLEKAIERFEQVITIDPKNAEAYLYLTDVYLSKDDKENGLKTLEKYKSLIEDPDVIQQVDQYIEEIKESKI